MQSEYERLKETLEMLQIPFTEGEKQHEKYITLESYTFEKETIEIIFDKKSGMYMELL